MTSLNNRWQIGRLIDRLFVLESSRVAALMNIEKISAGGEALRALALRLSQFQRERKENEHSSELAQFSRDLAEIGTDCDGGIDHRIERSRYYVDQFREMMRTFRVDRIEGYQTFYEFTQRRFFSVFRFIDRVGRRLAEFRRQLDELNDQIQAEQTLTLSRVSNQNQYSLVLLQSFIVELQIAADVALIFPLTYYSSHFFETILGHSVPSTVIATACFLIWGSIGLSRALKDKKRLDRIRKLVSEANSRVTTPQEEQKSRPSGGSSS